MIKNYHNVLKLYIQPLHYVTQVLHKMLWKQLSFVNNKIEIDQVCEFGT